MARDYVRHGIENPALYRLMFGGYLTGPEEDRPAIERTAVFNTKALLAFPSAIRPFKRRFSSSAAARTVGNTPGRGRNAPSF